jgi:hypothetical protein
MYILKPAVDGFKRYISSPAAKRQMINILRIFLTSPQTKIEIDKGITRVSRFISNIRLTISFRIKESEFVIDASSKLQINYAKDIKNSSVIMGENIQVDHSVSININISIDEIKQLKGLLQQIKDLNQVLSATESEKDNIVSNKDKIEKLEHQINKINEEVEICNKEIKNILYKVTDYKLLQQALQTH